MRERLRDKAWFPYTVTACIAVTVYVALTHLSTIWGVVSKFVGFFSPVIIALILAYIMNPLAKLFNKHLFGRLRSEKAGWSLSVIMAVVCMVLVLGFMLGTLVPQLAESVMTLVYNMDSYASSLQTLIDKFGLSEHIDLSSYLSSSGDIGRSVLSFLKSNSDSILNASAVAGKRVAKWTIALILAVYILMARDTLKSSAMRLMRALMSQKKYNRVTVFLGRCDRILVQYIVFSLLDALIVGIVNAVFMKCCGMQYIGLISMLVAITNLVPTFGPVIGGGIGAFILLLVKPLHALMFIAFTFLLQFLDGYIIKPRLFGNSLGVSGLLILIAVIVFGNMFGIAGILLAIPAAAILDFLYQEELLPALERRRAKAEGNA